MPPWSWLSSSTMPPSSSLPEWPPALTDERRNELARLATTYALAHGLLYLPPLPAGSTRQPRIPPSAIHAPISLFPTPFPRALFERAQRLQRLYNVLYARVALDVDFLDRVLGGETGLGTVDEYTGNLWKCWKTVRNVGYEQPLHLGIFRSDYLLHSPSTGGPTTLKQVEFNTISSSFGSLSERAAAMHRYLFKSTKYFHSSTYLNADNLPPNDTTAGIVDGLAAAHHAYCSLYRVNWREPKILFVVQEDERNVFDQRLLEFELLEKHSIRVIRQTLTDLSVSALVSPTRLLLVNDQLYNPSEISVVYFRATYTPNDFPSPNHYAVRTTIERSRAVKCPSLALHLAGSKGVQDVLCRDGVLEAFLLKDGPGGKFTKKDVNELRDSWMEMWALAAPSDAQSASSSAHTSDSISITIPPLSPLNSLEKTLSEHRSLVLKPQREGGGNNVYRDAIPGFLRTLPAKERAAWIAMRLIEPPQGVGGWLVRSGGEVVRSDVVSELGVFGWALFGPAMEVETKGEGDVVNVKRGEITEKTVGWLVRTKGRESDEGGVAVGFSVLDSVVLVD